MGGHTIVNCPGVQAMGSRRRRCWKSGQTGHSEAYCSISGDGANGSTDRQSGGAAGGKSNQSNRSGANERTSGGSEGRGAYPKVRLLE